MLAVGNETDLLIGWVDRLLLFEVVALGDQAHPDEPVCAGMLSPRCSIDRFCDPRVVYLLDRDVQGCSLWSLTPALPGGPRYACK